MIKLLAALLAGAAISSVAYASDVVSCATDPKTRADFIGAEMVRALDKGAGAIWREEWMAVVMRDAEIMSERLTVICAANSELPLSSALASLARPASPPLTALK